MKLKKILFLVGFAAIFMGFCQKAHAEDVLVKLARFFPDGKVDDSFEPKKFSDSCTVFEVLREITDSQCAASTDLRVYYNRPILRDASVELTVIGSVPDFKNFGNPDTTSLDQLNRIKKGKSSDGSGSARFLLFKVKCKTKKRQIRF
ncbi:MAG: hypothetical protein LBF32_04750 [Streptococcaceae bacterium]|jgi:hypothetical protein|nr:hypothetical protein [Streptococcaceae bacterium]